MKPQNPVQMAVIGAAHGIKGELRVKTFTGDPLALGDYGPLYARDGRAFEIEGIRPAGDVVVVRFKGIRDRTVAEGLTGTALFVDRSVLPAEEAGRVLSRRSGRARGPRRNRRRGRQGDRRAEFRRRRHPRNHVPWPQGPADPLFAGRRAAGGRRRRLHYRRHDRRRSRRGCRRGRNRPTRSATVSIQDSARAARRTPEATARWLEIAENVYRYTRCTAAT